MSPLDAHVRALMTERASLVERAAWALWTSDKTLRLQDMERRLHVGCCPLDDGTRVDTELAVRGVVRWRLSEVREGSEIRYVEEWL